MWWLNRHNRMRNALSIDVEEWFCVSNFAGVIRPEDWPEQETRIEMQMGRILDILEQHQVKATFFLLGWVAGRHPEMVRNIALAGHEIATHGYGHQLVSDLTPEQFREDLARSLKLVRDITGIDCRGYRAPSFSIRRDMPRAWAILAEQGIEYDSSVFPVLHDRYGEPDAPREPYCIPAASGSICEIPPSTVRLAGRNIPVAGGGYFRLYPYWVTKRAIQRINREGLSAVVYFHPWEIDPGHPRPPVSRLKLWRHRVGMKSFESKLHRLLSDFEFGPLEDLHRAVKIHTGGSR